MGVYLAMIGVADRVYLGAYLWKEEEWKTSSVCKFAGFLSMVSREVSAILICLITLDRFLVLHFPFRRVHFRKRSALAACAISWLVGIVIAAVPLLPAMAHWQFYSQTGICIPLPITRSDFPGRGYSFGVIIVLNLVLFLLIALGQAFIFWSVRTNSMSACDTSKKNKDLTVARRLISVAVCNFLCWFPIGFLGVMASNGMAVSDEVNVAMAIFVLPINSALNPFLYTVNLLLERRRRVQEERMMKRIKREMLMPATKQESRFNKISAQAKDSFRAKCHPT
ncbi:G-protein coupled receptor GRL101-like [Pomacea canaliculata]|uniref:G-protein coupled receptor GRL101-like n=1 Tax=Pomacea canaliculata TaxID=400727 RepID=UPI000D733B25|nr:G-protein coupled receptor GRL101-like [Pomacea canaliculata]